MLAGGALLARALRAGSRGRTAIQALAGAGLIAVGLRRRRSEGREAETGEWGDRPGAGGRTEADVRGTEEPETSTHTDEGDIEFTEEHEEPHTRPHLDAEEDPRRQDEGEGVDVDVSEAATADEASEAVQPDPEQAEPTSTEGTEPEATPEEDVAGGDMPEDKGETAGIDEEDEDEDAE